MGNNPRLTFIVMEKSGSLACIHLLERLEGYACLKELCSFVSECLPCGTAWLLIRGSELCNATLLSDDHVDTEPASGRNLLNAVSSLGLIKYPHKGGPLLQSRSNMEADSLGKVMLLLRPAP